MSPTGRTTDTGAGTGTGSGTGTGRPLGPTSASGTAPGGPGSPAAASSPRPAEPIGHDETREPEMTPEGVRLPIAPNDVLGRYVLRLLRRHGRVLGFAVVLQALAAVAALALPWLLGRIVDAVQAGTTVAVIDRTALAVAAAVVVGALLTRAAQVRTRVLGERIFAEVREQFLSAVTHLPLSTVERAGTGDLLARTTNDVDRIQWSVRFGIPQILIAVVTTVLTFAAAIVAAPAVSLGLLTGLPLTWWASRVYLRRARPAYIANAASFAELNGVLTEITEQAGTVDLLGLGPWRRLRTEDAVRTVWDTEIRTLSLRMHLFFWLFLSFAIPLVTSLLWGAHLVGQDAATLGQVTTVCLYALSLRNPISELVMWMDEFQVAAASLSRIVGVELVPSDRTPSGARPDGEDVVAREVRYAYRPGHDVLHGIDLTLAPGERLAVVGPSGAGKSTLGRMLAGIHPPTGGSVTSGGVPLVDLTEDELRSTVALVTQEHHVFVGTVADNLRLARPAATDEELWEALAAVDARTWVERLGDGLATEVGSGGHQLTPAQSQQVALARLVLLDPHTLVLDEATSLLDPRAARHLERSLSAVLHGRTVVAVAHRLHTSHDADRVAVVDAGLISEIGTHDELVARSGEYAALWHSWHGDD